MAQKFVQDLLVDPKTRGVEDVVHQVVAVGSLSGVEKAEQFLKSLGIQDATAYGNYEDLAQDSRVDIVYVASPHSHHYEHVKIALNTGKNVLNEKAFTINANQAKELYNLARVKDLFLMEAVWTRFFPASFKIRELIQDGAIGKVKRVYADFSFGLVDESTPATTRFLDPSQGGGSLLDLGVYALTWIFQTLYHPLPLSSRKPPTQVLAHALKFDREGVFVEDTASFIIGWEDCVGTGTCSMSIPTVPSSKPRSLDDKLSEKQAAPAVRIQGTKGEITVEFPIPRPVRFKLNGVLHEEGFEVPGGAFGWCFEADEVARCLRDGRKRSKVMTEEESVLIMETLDRIRAQVGTDYGELEKY